MSPQATLLSDKQGPLILLTLNRPEVLNALNMEMGQALDDALSQAAQDPQVAAVLITGAGRAFSAGGDLKLFARLAAQGDDQERRAFTSLKLPRLFLDFPKPLIAVINGPAVGWGLTMPLLCDLRLASSEAVFSAAFVAAGLTPEFGSSFMLPRLVGLGRALDLALTARRVGAEEALAMGLVNRVCPPDQLMPQALALGRQLAALPAPALRLAKKTLRFGADHNLAETLEKEIEIFREAMSTGEHAEAVARLLAGSKSKQK